MGFAEKNKRKNVISHLSFLTFFFPSAEFDILLYLLESVAREK